MNATTAGFNRYAAKVSQMEVLGDEKCNELLARYREAGDRDCLEKVISSNLRLVLKIAGTYRGMGTDYDDLVALGNQGLLYAAEKYDASRKAKFTVYAQYWIRHYMRRRGLDKSRVVSLGDYSRAKRAGKSLDVVSLDEQVGNDDDDRTLQDVIPSEEETAFDEVSRRDSIRAMMKALDTALNATERRVVLARFGMSDEDGRVKSLGQELRCSHQQVTNIYQNAIAKLRRAMTRTDEDFASGTPAGAHGEDEKKHEPARPAVEPRPESPAPAAPSDVPKMTIREAAVKVLREESRTMTVKEIAYTAIERGYWRTEKGKTPDHTLYPCLVRDIKNRGSRSRFFNDHGLFGLVEWKRNDVHC